MIPIIEADRLTPELILNRKKSETANVEAAVEEILETVQTQGDAALLAYTERFDNVKLESLRVSEEERKAARARVGEDFWKTLEMAAENIRRFHSQQLHRDFVLTDQPGIIMGQRYTPIEKVGICVPSKNLPGSVRII